MLTIFFFLEVCYLIKNENLFKDTVSKNAFREILKNSFKCSRNLNSDNIDFLVRTAEEDLDSADSARVEYKFLFNDVTY